MATWSAVNHSIIQSTYPNMGIMDPTETKNAIARKLEQEEESVKWLLERTQQSEELTNGMVSYLFLARTVDRLRSFPDSMMDFMWPSNGLSLRYSPLRLQ